MSVDPIRDAAIVVLLRVFEKGVYLNRALDKTLERRSPSERGRRFLTQLVYGTVRHKALADHVLTKLLHGVPEDLPRPIHAILRMGVIQSLFCRQVTFPAMVNTSVDLAKSWGHAGLARLVNAVLRKAPKSLDEVELPDPGRDRLAHIAVRYSMPRWLVERWTEEFDAEIAEELCAASNTEAPVTLRVNTLVTRTEDCLKGLQKAGYTARPYEGLPDVIEVVEGKPPARSKLFRQGCFLIQDPASMLPGYLMEPQAGERLLDLCAAPGGKTTHLAQLTGDAASVFGLDRRADKLKSAMENAARLKLNRVRFAAGDGTRPPWAARFDRVLVDAPCTGLGTLRRHPDLKWRIRAADPARLAEQQADLLRSAVRLCENKGVVVYSVCTLFSEETRGVTRAVVNEGKVTPEDGPPWLKRWKIGTGEYRTLPTLGGLDGFYLMRLRKVS